MVSISACHAEDPGSIPGGGVLSRCDMIYLVFLLVSKRAQLLSWHKKKLPGVIPRLCSHHLFFVHILSDEGASRGTEPGIIKNGAYIYTRACFCLAPTTGSAFLPAGGPLNVPRGFGLRVHGGTRRTGGLKTDSGARTQNVW